MGRPQFLQEVGGDSGSPISTSTEGVVETDNYSHGDAFAFDGGDLPQTVEPDEVMQELNVTSSGSDSVLRITTSGDDTFDLELHGGTGSFDKWEITSFEVRGSSNVSGGWAGE